MATFPPLSDPSQQADMLANPQPSPMVMQSLQQEDLAGIFQVHLRVNPDAPFDRNATMELAQMLFPVLLERYPTGARTLAKVVWEIHGQKGFDQFWPAIVADLETQRLFLQVMMQTQALTAALQQMAMGPPQEGPSPETTQAQEAGIQAEAAAQVQGAEHQMQQDAIATQQSWIKMVQQMHQLSQQMEQHRLQMQMQQEQHTQKLRLQEQQARQRRQSQNGKKQ